MRKLLLLLALAGTMGGQTPKRHSFLFHWENDSVGFLTGQSTDENYTNGLRFDVGSPGEHRWAQRVEALYCRTSLCGPAEQRERIVSYGFTHQFYTPARIDIISRRPDRPWAGVMYGSANLHIKDGDERDHLLEAQLGILGQAAGAHYLQSRWHQFIGYDVQPVGWPKQLRNEPILNLLYTYNRHFPIGSNRHADVTASPGFALGTLTTYPTLGATVRFGHNVNGAVPPPIEAVDGGPAPRPFELYALAGADVRYVVNNATLDGGFFRDGPSVTKTPLVHDFRAGASVRWRSFRLTYIMVSRSGEFTERDSRQVFHSLAVGFEP